MLSSTINLEQSMLAAQPFEEPEERTYGSVCGVETVPTQEQVFALERLAVGNARTRQRPALKRAPIGAGSTASIYASKKYSQTVQTIAIEAARKALAKKKKS